VLQDLGEAHDRNVLGLHDALLPGLRHLAAAEPGKARSGQPLTQRRNQRRAVCVTGRFAGGEKDARIGIRFDATSLSLHLR
jgi:hypothetical protein